MSESKTDVLLLMLMGIIILLMVAITGLFIHMNQLQREVVLAWDDAVARDYLVPGTPFFYVIDGAGVIANVGFAGTLKQLEALVEGDRGEGGGVTYKWRRVRRSKLKIEGKSAVKGGDRNGET